MVVMRSATASAGEVTDQDGSGGENDEKAGQLFWSPHEAFKYGHEDSVMKNTRRVIFEDQVCYLQDHLS
jgi:hypothetical protein